MPRLANHDKDTKEGEATQEHYYHGSNVRVW